jgi:hypothetical protein
MHRFMWDLHFQPLAGGGGRGGLPMAAVIHNTAQPPNSPWVMPGNYTVKLTANGKTITQTLTVKMDPRVKTPLSGLTEQFTLSKQLYSGAVEAQAVLQQLREMRAQIKQLQERAGQGTVSQALAAFDQKAAALEGTTGFGFGGGGGGTPDTLAAMGGALSSLMGLLQGADVAPTSQLAAAVADRLQALAKVMERWNALRTHDLEAMNAKLAQANLRLILIK